MVLYLDVIWLLNFCIDLLLLQLTAFILKRQIQKGRLLLGASIASLFILFLFTPLSSIMYQPLAKLGYSIVIVLCVFGYRRFYSFVQVLFMFYFVTFMIGGGMLALHYFMQGKGALLSGVAAHATPYGDRFSWGFVIIGFLLMWFFSKGRMQQVEAVKVRYDQMVSVDIEVEQIRIHAKGLVDSGNHLHDPITRTPVMILDLEVFKDYFPPSLVHRAQHPESFQEGEELPPEWESRIRLVPFQSVGVAHHFLLAFQPDQVKMNQNGDIRTCKKVYIGLHTRRLSGEGAFNCLVHPHLFLQKKQPSAS